MKTINVIKLSVLAAAMSSGMAMAAEQSSGVDAFIDGLDKNFAVTSNYVWRGKSASIGAPAVQGGVTWNHDSGVSVDVWFSSSGASVLTNEHDLTISYAAKTDKFGWEAGIIDYQYPQAGTAGSFHEFFGGININNLNAYLYINPDDDFGNNKYIELSADISRFNIALGVNSNDADANSYNQITTTVSLTNNLSLAWSETDEDSVRGEWSLTYNVPLK